MNIHTLANFLRSRGVLMILHVAIMLLSAWLIYIISVDTFENVSFYEEPKFQKQQFWICVVFMADFFIEFFLSHDKRHYLATHFIFFIVSIPYRGDTLPFRVGHFERCRLSCTLYAADPGRICDGNRSQLVYLQQGDRSFLYLSHHVVLNRIFCESDLLSFRIQGQSGCEMLSDALWWAAMDVTTVGSNIEAVTGVGRVLSVLLAALGMMMFPIFTVYVTNLITERNKQAGTHNDEISLVKAYRQFVKKHPDQAQSLRDETAGHGDSGAGN